MLYECNKKLRRGNGNLESMETVKNPCDMTYGKRFFQYAHITRMYIKKQKKCLYN